MEGGPVCGCGRPLPHRGRCSHARREAPVQVISRQRAAALVPLHEQLVSVWTAPVLDLNALAKVCCSIRELTGFTADTANEKRRESQLARRRGKK